MDKLNKARIDAIDKEIENYDANEQKGLYSIMRLRAEKRVRVVLNKILSSQTLDDADIEVVIKFFNAKDRYESKTNHLEYDEGEAIFYTLNGWINGRYISEEIDALKRAYNMYANPTVLEEKPNQR